MYDQALALFPFLFSLSPCPCPFCLFRFRCLGLQLHTLAPAPEPVDFRRLPAAEASVDAALLLLSAHELRTDDARGALFAELHRVLTPGGHVIVAEHLRDCANFAAFGPGFLHFFSRRTGRQCFARARFVVHREFSITPFVHVFVLRRAA